MSRQRELAKNTAILSFGTVVPKLVNLVTLPILTGYLTKAEYGTYDLVVSMVTLLLPLATLQLQAAAFRFLIEAKEDFEKQKNIVSCVIVVSVVLSIAMLTVLYFLMASIDSVTRILICSYYLLDILVCTFRQVARGLSKNVLYSVSVVVNAVSECVAVIGFVMVLKFGLNGALIASLAGQAVSLALLGIGLRIFSFIDLKSVSWKATKKLISYSWPLIPNSLSSWVISMSDRLILTIMIGIEASAVFAAASKIPHILGIFQSAFSLAWQENASLSCSDRDRNDYYSRMFDRFFSIVAGGLALLIAICPVLFVLLIRGDYAESYSHMCILLLGAFASSISSFFGGIYIAHMRTKEIAVTTAAVAVVNIIVEVALIPFLGIYAASISYTLSFAALATYRAICIQKIQPIDIDKRKLVLSIIVLIAMATSGVSQEIGAIVFNAITSVVMFALLNHEIVRMLVSKVRRGNGR